MTEKPSKQCHKVWDENAPTACDVTRARAGLDCKLVHSQEYADLANPKSMATQCGDGTN